jgi:hypothetical protein
MIFTKNLKKILWLQQMKDKFFIGIIGGVSIIVTGIPFHNYYILPVVRHKEMMDKIDEFDKRLKKLEK